MSSKNNTSTSNVNNSKEPGIVIGPKQEFFSWLPNCVIYEWGLSAEALGVALYLNGKPADWRVRPYDVQKHFGFKKTVWTRISKELRDCGLLHEIRGQSDRDLRFVLPEMQLAISKKSQCVKTTPCENHKVRKPALLTNKDVLPEKDYLLEKEKTLCSEQFDSKQGRGGQDILEHGDKPGNDKSVAAGNKEGYVTDEQIKLMFEKLWESYPHKKAKQKAVEALKKLMKGKTLAEAQSLAKAIWGGFKACVNEHKAKTQLKEQGADIFVPNLPHLSTWLNQLRWEDEYQDPTQILTSARKKTQILDINNLFILE